MSSRIEIWSCVIGFYLRNLLTASNLQRQTVISQFFQLDRLVVEGGKTVRDISLSEQVFLFRGQYFDYLRRANKQGIGVILYGKKMTSMFHFIRAPFELFPLQDTNCVRFS